MAPTREAAQTQHLQSNKHTKQWSTEIFCGEIKHKHFMNHMKFSNVREEHDQIIRQFSTGGAHLVDQLISIICTVYIYTQPSHLCPMTVLLCISSLHLSQVVWFASFTPALYTIDSKNCWVKNNPALGKFWTEHKDLIK